MSKEDKKAKKAAKKAAKAEKKANKTPMDVDVNYDQMLYEFNGLE